MRALEPYRGPWTKTHAAHLLNRAGFGGLPEEVARVVDWGMERAVDHLLDFEKIEATFPAPPMPELPERPLRELAGLTEEERRKKFQKLQRANREAIEELRGWWIRRMLRSLRPLEEKMTLFWHGHFATSADDVKRAGLMLRQNEFLRQHCLGNFRALLLGISHDPAMLEYLDNNTNRKAHPNENYARELMELFSMGIGHYTEQDVKEAARAFTGWTFRREEFTFVARQHDDGPKEFLNERGNFDGTDIIDIILKQPCTARFMAKKLFEFFVHEEPSATLVEELASALRSHRYEFKPWLRALFVSGVFYSEKAWRTQIKSPAQLVVGSVRMLGTDINERALAVAMRMLGQDLLYPPNVKGWDGGEAWINTNTLLMRYNMAGYLVKGQIPDGGRPSGAPGQRRYRLTRFGAPKTNLETTYGPDIAADAPRLVEALWARLLQAPIEPAARALLVEHAERVRVSERPAAVAHLIMSMPDYQLC